MITAYFSSVLEDSVEIFFIDVTCIVIKAATNNTFLQLNLTNTKHLNGSLYFYYKNASTKSNCPCRTFLPKQLCTRFMIMDL